MPERWPYDSNVAETGRLMVITEFCEEFESAEDVEGICAVVAAGGGF